LFRQKSSLSVSNNQNKTKKEREISRFCRLQNEKKEQNTQQNARKAKEKI
jgi:hypothetical protein